MPSLSTTVGAQPIPFPTAGAGTPIEDRAAVVLLDYLAFWLRYALDDKLAEIGGANPDLDPPENYASACPAANLFPYDPAKIWPRNPKPALYVWWNGRRRRIPKTMVYDLRERELSFVWIYCQTTTPDGGVARSGLTAAVDAVLARAEHKGRHTGWSYGTFPANTLVSTVAGLHSWEIGQTEPGAYAPVVSSSSEGYESNFYPVVRGTILVRERVYNDQPEAPDDLNTDPSVTIGTNEENPAEEALDLYEIRIPTPFGSGE